MSVSGGLRPSLLGGASRQAGDAIQTQALQALMSGSDVPAMPDFDKTLLTPPEATALPQATSTDKWLNILATIGQIAQGGSTLYGMNKRPGGQTSAPTVPGTGMSGSPTDWSD